jgi:23S rRNA pseudouridine1911/1915/1917 synthase
MRYLVTAEQSGIRLDVYLTSQQASFNRSTITKLIKQGEVTINKQVPSASQKVKIGDVIEIEPVKPLGKLELEIIYEDDDCLVINKPAGVLSHSKGQLNAESTVATFIYPKLDPILKNPSNNRSGIVHRLDRATSGLMICAKNIRGQKILQNRFKNRQVEKEYLALVSGQVEPKEALIDAAIARNQSRPYTFIVSKAGKPAQTKYIVLEQYQNFSLLLLCPVTGRTHQLRVHLGYIGHPIVGDTLYDGQPNKRLLLHARSLKLTLPNGQLKKFIAKTPKDFQL